MRPSILLTLRIMSVLMALLAAPFAMAAEPVKVRVGEHPGFDRLVFDWVKPVGVRLESTSGQARLIFDRVGDLDLSRVRKDPPPSVRGVTQDGLNVVVKIVPGAKVRLWESGSSAVLDIRPQDPAPDANLAKPEVANNKAKAASPAAQSTRPEPVPVANIEKTQAARLKSAPTSLTTPHVLPPVAAQGGARDRGAAPPESVKAPPASRAPAPLSLLDARPQPEEVKREKSPSAGAGTPPVVKGPPRPPRAKPGQGRAKSKAASKKANVSAPAPPSKASTPGRALEKGRRGTLLVVADQGPSILDSTAINFFDGVPQTMNNIRFQWDAETAMAVYRRGPHLWLVFDREAPGDVTIGLAELAPEMVPIQQFPAPNATLIRMTPPPIMEPKISRDGNTWVMELWPRPPRSTSSVEIAIEGDPTAARINFAIELPGHQVSFDDPDSGSSMIVVPALIAEQKLAVAQAFPQFRALRSFQGLALELMDNELRINVAGSGVQITHPKGLIVSKGGTLALLKSNVRRTAVGPRLFDLSAWRRPQDGTFVMVRHELQAALAEAGPDRRAIARLDLARFYFAHGFANEAAGLLSVGQTLDPDMLIDPETRLMRGVATFLGGDYGGAAKDLFHSSLNGEAEADLWNGAMAAIGFDWDVASTKFAENRHLIADYPHRVRMRLWLMAAEAEMAASKLEAAGEYMTAALKDNPNRDEESQIAVLTGYSYLKKDQKEKARDLWQSVVSFSNHPPSQTRARLALLDLAVAEKSITAAEAIEELERLRFAWRGDSIEIALLQRLGDLYLSQGRYHDSLTAFRQATVSAPSSRFARDVAQRMRDVFFDIIAGEEGRDLPPLSVLALYEEFKELSPPSVKGDRMLERLADRLVEVDLLPRATELLTAQIKYRLSGAQKAATGARVASLHLLDDVPEKAITVLGLSEAAGLPEDLKQRRLYLRARALSRLSRYEEALKLISDDPYPEALRLRVDILWVQSNWRSAAVILKQLVPAEPRADQVITDEDSRNVADLAIALTLSGEDAELAALGEVYKEAMAAGPDRETFAFLTDGPTGKASRSIADQLASVKKVEDFMTSYRERAQTAKVQ